MSNILPYYFFEFEAYSMQKKYCTFATRITLLAVNIDNASKEKCHFYTSHSCRKS